MDTDQLLSELLKSAADDVDVIRDDAKRASFNALPFPKTPAELAVAIKQANAAGMDKAAIWGLLARAVPWAMRGAGHVMRWGGKQLGPQSAVGSKLYSGAGKAFSGAGRRSAALQAGSKAYTGGIGNYVRTGYFNPVSHLRAGMPAASRAGQIFRGATVASMAMPMATYGLNAMSGHDPAAAAEATRQQGPTQLGALQAGMQQQPGMMGAQQQPGMMHEAGLPPAAQQIMARFGGQNPVTGGYNAYADRMR